MENPETMKPDCDSESPLKLPNDLQGHCRQIAQEIHERTTVVRDDKILTARVRICSGYYDSEDVLHAIADRLLSEGYTRPASS
jgi:hypothetical protein